jgi:transposase-like protein
MPHSRKRISDQIREAIIAADPSISNCELARQYGISDPSVRKIRKDAGIVLQRAPKIARPKKAKVKQPAKRTALVHAPVVAKKPFLLTITLEIEERRADALWNTFSGDDKAVAIRAALMSRLEV